MEQIEGPKPEVDFISTMPGNVITHILDRVPIQYAVRTSVLSRSWRYKWTTLSQLVFDDNLFLYLEKKGIEEDSESIINQILHYHKGDITKFKLVVSRNLDAEYINDWVLLLSENGIKDFTFTNFAGPETPFKLPAHLFVCLQLKHLKLHLCSVSAIPSNFSAFPNLVSLDLYWVVFESCTLGELINRCPLLEILILASHTTDSIKREDIVKHEYLKELSLPLCELDKREMITSSDVLQLMSVFSNLQGLHLDLWNCKVLADNKQPTSLPCLKALRLSNINFSCANLVSLAYALIHAFPNLEELLIEGDMEEPDDVVPPLVDIDDSRMQLLQLRELEFETIYVSENVLSLMKSLLASSPLLQRMTINAFSSDVPDEDTMFCRKLLKLRRSSSDAEIDLSWIS